MQKLSSTQLDTVAIMLSGFCLLHCLILPFVLTLMPLSQVLLAVDEHSFHRLLLIVIMPTSILALMIGCRKHKDVIALVLATIGLVMLILTSLLSHELFNIGTERILTSIGSLILALAHIRNFHVCRQHDCH